MHLYRGGSSSGWCPGNQWGSRLNPEGREKRRRDKRNQPTARSLSNQPHSYFWGNREWVLSKLRKERNHPLIHSLIHSFSLLIFEFLYILSSELGPENIRIKKNSPPTMGWKWLFFVIACIICCFKVVSKLKRKNNRLKI